MSNDPWKNRSENMKCRTCMHFKEKVTEIQRRPDHFIGRCRRHAPTMGGFPVVYSDDWCGDHKLDENKSGENVEMYDYTQHLNKEGL